MSPTCTVRSPASTSNLGPGFDFLGLALDLDLEVEWLGESNAGRHAFDSLEGTAEEWPREENLLFRAFDAALVHYGREPRTGIFRAGSRIPLCRGLGSSGAAVAAGLLLGAAVAEVEIPDRDQLAKLGLQLEGHPDNSTASLIGGCTLAVPIGRDELRIVRHPLCERLVFGVVWPDSTLATERARSALPREIPFADAVENPRRLALLLEGLRLGDGELIRLGSEDRLHSAYRLPLIPGAAEAIEAAREAGAWTTTISGSGSALIAIADDPRIATEAARAIAKTLLTKNRWVEQRVLGARMEGADVRRS
jgi:homoserine kinase